jgi:hypothetical protein
MILLLLFSFFLDTGAHDFHVSTANVAVENNVAVCRIRFFKDDLEATLAHFHGREGIKMGRSAEIDSLFLAYFEERFSLTAGESQLEAIIIDSGEDLGDREAVWWYTLQFEAEEHIRALRVRNELLFDLYSDQQNVFKVVHFPDEMQRSYYFTEEDHQAEIVF